MTERLFGDPAPTLRPVNAGAERWLGVPIECLDHGFVYLVDYMGGDEAIAQAARVSYGKGTKKANEDRGLIRHLSRETHTSPFEMVEFKFHAKMPIFVARQWIRHRTANVNEHSGRYSEMSEEFYLPEPEALRKQSKTNKQGRDEELTHEQKKFVLALLLAEYDQQRKDYQQLLEIDFARELARLPLSVANYTEWYWKIDLHNLMHFLRLRLDAHAQYEIRVYGEAMARIVKDAVPIAYEAFEDYVLHSMNLSRGEIELIAESGWPMPEVMARASALAKFRNKRESEECVAKLKRMRLIL